ncbi:MAG TPA: hypothetical protein VNN76_12400 [Bacteroidota bacterium]|nr:hypothetical protein [Bacteroidota bacterium]
MERVDDGIQAVHRYRKHPRGSSPASWDVQNTTNKQSRTCQKNHQQEQESPHETIGENSPPIPTGPNVSEWSLWRDDGGESG